MVLALDDSLPDFIFALTGNRVLALLTPSAWTGARLGLLLLWAPT
jgi:hypothetical protein